MEIFNYLLQGDFNYAQQLIDRRKVYVCEKTVDLVVQNNKPQFLPFLIKNKAFNSWASSVIHYFNFASEKGLVEIAEILFPLVEVGSVFCNSLSPSKEYLEFRKLLWQARLFCPESAFHHSRFPLDLLRVLLSYFNPYRMLYLVADLIEVKKIKINPIELISRLLARKHFGMTWTALKLGLHLHARSTSPLICAAIKADADDIAKFFIKSQSQIFAATIAEQPLYYALQQKKMDMYQLLLQHGANEEILFRSGMRQAIADDSRDMADILFEKTDKFVQYHISGTISRGWIDLTLKILEKAPNLTLYGFYPAIEHNQFELLKKLQQMSPTDFDPTKLMRTAVQFNRFDIVKYLSQHGADLMYIPKRTGNWRVYNISLVDTAILNNNFEIALYLLDLNAPASTQQIRKDIGYHGTTLLIHAIQNGRLDVALKIARLAPHSVSVPDALNHKPLHYAVLAKDLSALKMLFDNFEEHLKVVSDKPHKGCSPMHYAAKKGGEVAQLLIAHSMHLDSDYGSWTHFDTPLTVAIKKKHIDVAKELVLSKANINHLNAENQTPLSLALCKIKDKALVHFLLDHGAAFNSHPHIGPMCLSTALVCHKKLSDLLPLILQTVSPSWSERFQHNPLVLAVRTKDPAIVTLLLDRGADPNLGKKTQNPLFVSRLLCLDEITKILTHALSHKNHIQSNNNN